MQDGRETIDESTAPIIGFNKLLISYSRPDSRVRPHTPEVISYSHGSSARAREYKLKSPMLPSFDVSSLLMWKIGLPIL